jgi:perosamine synthetase
MSRTDTTASAAPSVSVSSEPRRINQMEPWIGAEEQEAVSRYLASGAWLTEFQQTREFETMIGAYIGSDKVSVMANGTVTLFASLMALGIGPGDEVIVPDYTMIASANAIELAGATPVFVDVAAENLCLDIGLTERAITRKTKAIMLVTLNGRAPDMRAFSELASRKGIHLVEDAAQSLGSFQGGKHLGTFGIIGSFSFSAPKIITTGQGGAVTTRDAQLFERMKKIKDFGRKAAGVDFHEDVGYNFKTSDVLSVIGIEQMKKLPWRVDRKKAIYARYEKNLAGVEQVSFLPTNLTDVAPWFIDVLVPDPGALREALGKANIGSRPFYPAIHSQPAYGLTGSYPHAEHAAKHGLWLPSSSFLTDADIDRVCDMIRAFYAR